MATTTPPGWYADPAGSGGQRWWDGTDWSLATKTPTEPAASTPGRGVTMGATICGIVGVVIGLVPLLGIFALALGVVAIVLGAISYRTGKRVGRRQGRAGIILGVLSIILSVIGLVIVSNAFDKLDSDLDCLSNARTAAQVDACD